MRKVLLALPTLLTACFGPDQVGYFGCTDMYAPSGASIDFEGGAMEEGAYLLEVGSVACEVTVAAGAWGAFCEAEEGPAALEVYLSDSGDRIEGAWLMEEAPDPLDITLSRDGEVLFEDSFTPDYERDEPNGVGCGERDYAIIDVTLGA